MIEVSSHHATPMLTVPTMMVPIDLIFEALDFAEEELAPKCEERVDSLIAEHKELIWKWISRLRKFYKDYCVSIMDKRTLDAIGLHPDGPMKRFHEPGYHRRELRRKVCSSDWVLHSATEFQAARVLLEISIAADTITPTQSITVSDGQTLVSSAQTFELGFFSPGNSKNNYIGIWYKNSPSVVLWVANRETQLQIHPEC
ncbi:hypothetical protein HHK36_030791 [Tetracentron sinense]|uniref:Bulb-type lectin domain-containing protein n=1 Tax=Tetracentron sinense TaxID=13715 RepID=A0A834YAG5_TETSI|nr:hypothetical protein HHK36_030791 [Tetracentron sinense]